MPKLSTIEILQRMKVETKDIIVTGMSGKELWQVLTDESIQKVIDAVHVGEKHNA